MLPDVRRGLWKNQDTILQIKNLRKLVNWLKRLNIAVIVDYFVSNHPEIEECYNLAPVIKNLKDNADLLNAFFIDNEKCFFLFSHRRKISN